MYVKLSDLEKVTETWIEANPTLMASKTKQEIIEFQTLNRDQSLYQEGIYLSPNLKTPVLSGFTYAMFILALAAFVLTREQGNSLKTLNFTLIMRRGSKHK